MSDTQWDREERQHVIEVLQEMVDWMQAANYIVAKPERIHALCYAIASIKTDLKYDLLYEETSGQADKPTTPNDCETCIHNKGVLECDMYGCKYEPTTKNDLVVDCISRKSVIEEMEKRHAEGDYITKGFINSLPSVTPQLSSELDKNSKKDFGESDCISRADVNQVIEDYIDEQYHVLSDRTRERAHGAKIVGARINELSSVTPQEPRKGHWISHREHCEMNNLLPSGLGSYFWCSECDCGIDSKDFTRVNYNYCPNCGAKMVEPQESEG